MTAHLCDRVIPRVPLRQWTVSFPFALRRLLALYRVKPMLGAGLLAAIAMAATRRFRHVHQMFFALNAVGFTAAVAMSIQPEQRHMHVVEVMLIVSFVMSIGQCLQPLGVPGTDDRALGEGGLPPEVEPSGNAGSILQSPIVLEDRRSQSGTPRPLRSRAAHVPSSSRASDVSPSR